MNRAQSPSPSGSRIRRVLTLMVLASAMIAAGVTAQTVSTLPLILPQALPPNIVVTLDDSGSMQWAFVPDSTCSLSGTRRGMSAYRNPIWYDPNDTYPAPLDANGNPLTTSFSNAYINGYDTTRGSIDLGSKYRPSWEYNPVSNILPTSAGSSPFQCPNSAGSGNWHAFNQHPSADLTTIGAATVNSVGKAYYYKWNTSCTAAQIDTESCYTLVIVSSTSGPPDATHPSGTDERQNFANWYSFYRVRSLAVKAAAATAFAGVGPDTRVAFQSLNTCNSLPISNCNSLGFDNKIRKFQGSQKTNFYKWVFTLPAAGGTPLQSALSRAGDYYKTSGLSSPYALDPQVTLGTEYACRPNFHIAMTDGQWNGSYGTCGGGSCGNVDNTNRTLPDATAYSASSPYKDTQSNTLADEAFYYWATDLRPDLANKVIPRFSDRSGPTASAQYWNAKNDPATWQHMVNFTVGLGLTGQLNVTNATWGGSTFAGDYANLASGSVAWPSVGSLSGSSNGKVYDLWHAAINSRGQFFSADSPTQLNAALNSAIKATLSRQASSSSLATNSTRLDTGTVVFQARFNSGDWSGQMTAYSLNADGTLASAIWDTYNTPSLIPTPPQRKIYSWTGSAGVSFDSTGITSAMWTAMGLGAAPAATQTSILNYLRGDQSNEQSNSGSYRTRSSVLGDIVDSDPVFSGGGNFGYSVLPEGLATATEPYNDYLTFKRGATRANMIYIGSNDGMLHGFNAATGAETFAYVPRTVLSNLTQLTDPNYTHLFYVDGSPFVGDAYFSGSPAGERWRSTLVGVTGAGGNAVFALDVRQPSDFANATTGASRVLWERNAGDSGFQDLGYTIGRPIIARLNSGDWAAVFGNGYGSTYGCAVLYIVRLSDGAILKKIDTQTRATSTTPCTGGANGLSSPSLLDVTGDRVIDVIYAGDIQGNVWKFDVSSSNPASWGVAYSNAGNPAPLFTARNASGAVEPITGVIEIGAPPQGRTGNMVYAGTGRFYAIGDQVDMTVQSIYGIYDDGTAITRSSRTVPSAATYPLVQQTYTTSTVGLVNVRDFTTTVVDYSSKRGWYVDLQNSPLDGERVVSNVQLSAGRLFVRSFTPSADPCDFGGTGWFMALDPYTGGQLSYSVLDINGDGSFNSTDNHAGMQVKGGRGMSLIYGGAYGRALLGNSDASVSAIRIAGDPNSGGRASWREVQQ